MNRPATLRGVPSPDPAHPSVADVDDYVLGRDAAETRRLILQHRVYASMTRRFLVGAGITAGMKVLDIGSGAGDVSMLLADLVGPGGSVVGVDMSAESIAGAAARVDALGVDNVRFVRCDLRRLELDDGGFDAVVGRWVLMYIPRPAQLLRRLRTLVRIGGILAFQESDLDSTPRAFPEVPIVEQLREWLNPPIDVPGVERRMGPKLASTFAAAGLGRPQMHFDMPIGGGDDWPGYELLAATARTIAPRLAELGVIAAPSLDLDDLADRLRDEVVDHDAVLSLAPLVGAWARAR